MDKKLDLDQPAVDEAHLYELHDVEIPHNAHEHMMALSAPWLTWAESKIGQHETARTGKSNQFILDCFKHTTYHAVSDSTPWCSAFVCRGLEETGFKSTHSAWAFSYNDYGTKSDLKPGALVVLKWPNGGGHVTIVKSVGKGVIACVGGNQGDSVKVSVFSTAHVHAVRWPVK